MKKLGERQQYLLDWFTLRYTEDGELACGLSEAAASRSGYNANYGSYKASAQTLVERGLLEEVQIPGPRGMRRGYIPARSTVHSSQSALSRIF